MKRLNLFVIALLIALTINAQKFEVEGLEYNILSATAKTVEVGAADRWWLDMDTLIVPEEVTFQGVTYSVIALKSHAFETTKVASVTIPSSVIYIGDYAFSSCKNIKEIVIPNSVKVIGASVFYNCESLKSLVIPNSVVMIGEKLCHWCASLERVTIGNSLEVISSSAFSWCDKLSIITFGNSVRKMIGLLMTANR